MQTKVSVVIPTYRRPILLINCLRQLIKQTIDPTNFEIIVVSDGYDAETENALRPWLRKVNNLTYLSTLERRGPAAARNLGWLTAKSPLIAFTDDDCLPDKNWLKGFLRLYNGEVLVAFTGQTTVPLPSAPTDFAMNTAGLENAEFITANCACTKAALYKTGGFDERFSLAWREDSDLHFKLLEHGIPILKVEGARVVHPVRQANWGISIKEQRKAIFEALLFSKHPDLYAQKIGRRFLWNYYLINLLWVLLFLAIVTQQKQLIKATVAALVVLLAAFAWKRLRSTSKRPSHLLEMLVTSILIPSISVYWRIYGAIKYRTKFI